MHDIWVNVQVQIIVLHIIYELQYNEYNFVHYCFWREKYSKTVKLENFFLSAFFQNFLVNLKQGLSLPMTMWVLISFLFQCDICFEYAISCFAKA